MTERGYASSPCYMHEFDDSARAVSPPDPDNWSEIARWRKLQREDLIENRLELSVSTRQETSRHIAATLDKTVDVASNPVIGVYWPFRGEPDLRDWMRRVTERGGRIALPEVIGKTKPLVFREWTPGCPMRHGVWKIPVPDNDTCLLPDIVISPVVGADAAGFRLGYGGGFYDRTLASLSPRARAIGVGHVVSSLQTIYPQPHDIVMDEMILVDPARDLAQ